ncbi:MAG: hypothetical protein AAFR17_05570 [Pseudomonadota bacterium]
MRPALLLPPAMAVAIALGLAAAANAAPVESAGAQATVEAATEITAKTARKGLRPAHDGRSGIDRTRTKRFLLDPVPQTRVAAPEGPSLFERLFAR